MILTANAREKLESDQVKMKICLELGIAYVTIRRWLKDEVVHENLTKKKSIEAIVKFTGLKESEIFEQESAS